MGWLLTFVVVRWLSVVPAIIPPAIAIITVAIASLGISISIIGRGTVSVAAFIPSPATLMTAMVVVVMLALLG